MEIWKSFLNEQCAKKEKKLTEEEPFQKAVKKGYLKKRDQYTTTGPQKTGGAPFDKEPKRSRSQSSPLAGYPVAEDNELEERFKDFMKRVFSTEKTKDDAAAREEVEKWQRNFYLRWSNRELKANRYEQAVALLEQGIVNHADDARLIGNLAYAVQQWARGLHEEKGAEATREMLLQQLEHFSEFKNIAEVAQNHARNVFIEHCNHHAFSAAIESLAANAQLFHDSGESTKLYRNGISNWARHCMSERKWEEALRVIQMGLERLTGDTRLTGNLTYCIQEWGKDLLATDGAAAASKMLLEQTQQLAGIKEISRIAEQFVNNLVETSLRSKKFEEALQVLEEHGELLRKASIRKLVHRIFDQHAMLHQQDQEWEAAIDVYLNGLKRYPNDRHLTHNAVVCCHRWASGFMKQQNWTAAIQVYNKSLKLFPDVHSLTQNLKYCQQQMSKQE